MARKDVGANLTVVVDITLLREEVGGTDKEDKFEDLKKGMKRQEDYLKPIKTCFNQRHVVL